MTGGFMQFYGVPFLVTAFFVLTGTTVSAGDDYPNDFSLRGKYIFSSDIKAQDGDIIILETKLILKHEFKVYEKLPIEISLRVKHINLFEDINKVNVPETMKDRGLGIGTKLPVPFIDDDRFYMGFDVFPSFQTAVGHGLASQSFRIPFRSYLIYKESEELIIVGGVKIRPEYETDVLPLIGLLYKPNDKLSINFLSEDPNVSYQINDKTKVIWEFDYTTEEYEVTRKSEKGRVIQYYSASTGIGIEHQCKENIQVSAFVGGVFGRKNCV